MVSVVQCWECILSVLFQRALFWSNIASPLNPTNQSGSNFLHIHIFLCFSVCVYACMYSVCVIETPAMMCAQVCLLMAPKWLSVWSSTSPVGKWEGSNAEHKQCHLDAVHLDQTHCSSMCWQSVPPYLTDSNKHSVHRYITLLLYIIYYTILCKLSMVSVDWRPLAYDVSECHYKH